MSKNAKILLLFLVFMLGLSACNLPDGQAEKNDPNIVFTAAAQTAAVQLTEAAKPNTSSTQNPIKLLASPTVAPPNPTLLPIKTPTEDNCDSAKFITDVTVLDDTIFPPGQSFTKTWRIKNEGTCTWTSDYDFVFASGEQMGGVSSKPMMGSVAPGSTVDISVDLISPTQDGSYVGNWKIRNNKNILFAKVYVQIKVKSGDFAVTSVTNINSSYVASSGAELSAKVTTNKAGNVEYHWILRESGQADLKTSVEEIEFSTGGTKKVEALWKGCPHAGNFVAYLYIDYPNHQEFGQASFSCP